MISRLFGPATGLAALALLAVQLVTVPAALAAGPGYTYIGVGYEWTDTKFGTTPADDSRFNNGSIEGENLEGSIGFMGLFHVRGQAFGYLNGTCSSCNSNPDGSTFDADVEGYKVGFGLNPGLDLIGLSDQVDLVVRFNYIDIEFSNLNFNSPGSVDDDGYSVEVGLAGRISDRADVFASYEYTDLGDSGSRDVLLGIQYNVWAGLTVMTRGIVFDNETGFELGLRWNFGDLLPVL